MKKFSDWYIDKFGLILCCLIGSFLVGVCCVLCWMGGQYGKSF